MAHTEHPPIYKAAYDLCLWLEQVVRGVGDKCFKRGTGSIATACAALFGQVDRKPIVRRSFERKSRGAMLENGRLKYLSAATLVRSISSSRIPSDGRSVARAVAATFAAA